MLDCLLCAAADSKILFFEVGFRGGFRLDFGLFDEAYEKSKIGLLFVGFFECYF